MILASGISVLVMTHQMHTLRSNRPVHVCVRETYLIAAVLMKSCAQTCIMHCQRLVHDLGIPARSLRLVIVFFIFVLFFFLSNNHQDWLQKVHVTSYIYLECWTDTHTCTS